MLVNKNLSIDKSFGGDFNLDNDIVSRNKNNKFIFTGVQIIDRNIFSSNKEKIFSMNQIWDKLISNKNLFAIESFQKFYHLNTKEMYDKVLKIKFTN